MTLLRRRCNWHLVLTSLATLAAGSGGAAVASAPPPMTVPLSPEESRLREDWRTSMVQIPLPGKACFQAAYPSKLWLAVPCTTPPPFPMVPRRGPRPLTVGNAKDVSAQAPTGFISSTTGTFTVTGVTNESAPIGNAGSPVADAYSLQINTNFFTGSVCAGSPNPACRAWEQFVFYNFGSGRNAGLYIAYWLIAYNAACPAGKGWSQFSFNGSSDIYCWKFNSLGGAPVPNQPITNLGQLAMTGAVSATADQILLSTGTMMYSVPGDNTVNAAAGWQIAEFNVFGPGGNSAGGSQASFNSGSTINPRVEIIYGGADPPICIAEGFTGETNNLSSGPTAPAASPPGPALIFTESSAGGATSNCAAATSVGGAPCVAGSTTLCLGNNRFQVTATYNAGGGDAGTAQTVAFSDDTGYLWFFEASNVEVVLKVLDGCGLGGHYWFFAGGLTNVNVVISVTDTQTGARRIYTNPLNTTFEAIQDTSAFSTCP
jgi:hypothetical protein